MNYQKIYDSLINSRLKTTTPSDYYETHHILPRCLGGTDDEENLIRLTAREHFFAHLLLAKIHGGKLWHGLHLMASRVTGRISSHIYEMQRKHSAKVHSKFMKGRKPPNFGKKMSDAQKRKLSKAHSGKTLSSEHRLKVLAALGRRERDEEWGNNISKGLMGGIRSPETRFKISESLKGNIPYNKGIPAKIVKCPHCEKEGGASIMKRWHFENCKNKT